MLTVPAISAKLFFQSPDFNAQLLRSLGKASIAGSDVGDCLATAFQIHDGDFESWYQQWKLTADRVFNIAHHCEKDSHYVSALSAYLRSCEYYRQAEFFLRDNLEDPRVLQSADHIHDSFSKAIPFLPYYVVPVEIPYYNSFLYGYYCQFHLEKDPKGTILLPGGYDSYAEELFYTAIEFLKRDYNVLILDGPGQGQTLRKNKLYMRPDWENVIEPVLNYVRKLPYTANNKIIMMGRSLGGYLAARAASGDYEFAALICDPGQWDLFEMAQRLFPPEILQGILAEQDEEINNGFFQQLFTDKNLAFYFKSRMAVHNTKNPCEWIRMLQSYTLRDQSKNIRCPALICYATAEDKVPGQAQILAKALGEKAQLMQFSTEEGAGDHCEAGAPQLFAQRVGDWLDEQMEA